MNQTKLKWGHTYHIYNRGNNRSQIFYEEENYSYFMRLFKKYLLPYVELYAYCLLSNHFHLLLRIKEQAEFIRGSQVNISLRLGTFFGTYVKAINHRYKRTGSLFEGRYQRKEVKNDNQLFSTLAYIHQNPQKHDLVSSFEDWPHSSYQNYLDRNPDDLIAPTFIHDSLIYDSIMELHK